MSDKLTLPYGYSQGIPEGVPAAWGCRAIFNHGEVDILPDRTGYAGEDKARQLLGDYLWDHVRDLWHRCAKDMYDSGELADQQGHVLYENDRVVVKGRAAGGYLYVCAYLRPDPVPDTEPSGGPAERAEGRK